MQEANITLREATADDQATIKQMVRQARLDPTSLKWENFLVAEHNGDVVAIGQVKQYPNCEELGSLVTRKAYQGQGIASRIIAALEDRASRPLYLLCAAHMESYYLRFGYETISWWQAPAFLKLKVAPALILLPFGIRVHIMRKE